MIQCTVCQAENDEFAITCGKCRSYLQNRVANLDLFEMAWMIIEQPRVAFRRIRIADHKNYAVSLFAFFGVGLTFAMTWMFRLGDMYGSLLELIIVGLMLGLVVGVLVAGPFTAVYWLIAKLLRGSASFRDALGILAYALIPIIISVILLLPIELLTFGIYLFTHNPHPMTLKPELYIALIGLDGAFAFWSVVLLFIGTKEGQQMGVIRTMITTIITVGLILSGLYVAGSLIVSAWMSA